MSDKTISPGVRAAREAVLAHRPGLYVLYAPPRSGKTAFGLLGANDEPLPVTERTAPAFRLPDPDPDQLAAQTLELEAYCRKHGYTLDTSGPRPVVMVKIPSARELKKRLARARAAHGFPATNKGGRK